MVSWTSKIRSPLGGVDMGGLQPPLTGGRKAISSPESSGVPHAANSWLREATSELRYRASSGRRAKNPANKSSMREPDASSTNSSAAPAASLSRPKKRTLTRMDGFTLDGATLLTNEL